MEKVLVSACLLGDPVRYNGAALIFEDQMLIQWHKEGRLVCICPEVAGGLPVPRPRSEIVGGDGHSVLTGQSSVISITGQDVTRFFLTGAQKALGLARAYNIRFAIFKEGSPSCGSGYIYDGSFSGIKKPGNGVAAALLDKNGVRVLSERNISEAKKYFDLRRTWPTTA